MIFVKNSRGGREVNMINTLSKINLPKIGWEGGMSKFHIREGGSISFKNIKSKKILIIRVGAGMA